MNRLLNEILSSVWLIDNERSAYYASLVHTLFNGGSINQGDLSIERAKARSYVLAGGGPDQSFGLRDESIPAGSMAIIPIRSEIMKYDQECGPRGTMSIMDEIDAVNKNPNISGILLLIDSPGGQVSATDLLAEKIRTSPKPVVAYVEGLCASAALWIAAGSDKIFASSDLDRIGSIGVMLAFADLKPYYEKLGVKFHEFTATLSTDKNKEFKDVLSGNYESYRTEVLDKINEKFIAHIKQCRPAVSEDALSGKMFFAQDAIAAGLLDEIGSFQSALAYTANLAVQYSQVQSKHNDNMKFSSKWNTLMGFFGLSTDQADAEEMTAERIGQLDQEMSNLKSRNEQLEASVQKEASAKQQALDSLAAEKLSHDATRKAFEDLKAEDAGGETTASKDKDMITGDNPAPAVYGHDKLAEKFLGK